MHLLTYKIISILLCNNYYMMTFVKDVGVTILFTYIKCIKIILCCIRCIGKSRVYSYVYICVDYKKSLWCKAIVYVWV